MSLSELFTLAVMLFIYLVKNRSQLIVTLIFSSLSELKFCSMKSGLDKVLLVADSKYFTFIRVKLNGPIRFAGLKVNKIILEALGFLGVFDCKTDYCIICKMPNFALDSVNKDTDI